MNITEEEHHTILGALDSLGTALADHDHEWTEGERAIYEAAVECVLRANTQQCRLAGARGCAAAEGCAAPVAWKSVALANMRAAKARKREANPVEREPKLVRYYPLQFGVRDKRTGDTAWIDFKSVRDASRRLAVIRRFYR